MRHNFLYLVVVVFLFTICAAQAQNSVAIGTSTANPKAVLTLVGSNQGLIIPKVSDHTAIGASSSADAGMIVFNTTDSKVYAFNGTTWGTVGASGSGSTYTLSYDAITKIISLVSGSTGTPTINISATTLTGDLGGTLGTPTVTGIQGKAVSATAPTTNQILQFNGTNWVPANLPSGTLPAAGANQILTSNASSVPTWSNTISGNAITSGTIAGTTAINSSGAITTTGIATVAGLTVSGATTSLNNKTYTWPNNPTLTAGTFLQTDASGNLSWATPPGSLPTPGANQILTSDNTGAPKWASTIAGSQVNPNFVAQNITTSGNIVTTGTGNLTVAGTTTFGTKAYTWPSTTLTAGTFLQTNASGTLSWVSIPGGGDMLKSTYDPTNKSADAFDLTKHSGILALANGGTGISTTPTANQVLTTNGTGVVGWINQSALPGGPILSATQVLTGNGITNSAVTLSGDASINAGALTVKGIQGKPVSATVPTSNQVLQFNGTNWAPATLTAMSTTTYDTNNDGVVDKAAALTTTLPITNGGTGATTAATALSALGGVALGGDLGGTSASPTVAKLGGQAYTFPASNATIGVLTNAAGTGTLTWAPVSGFLTTALPSGNIIVGNSAGVASQTAMSGDATLSNTGVLTIATTSGNNIVNAINSAATTGSITDSKLATISTLGKVSGNAIQSGTIGGTTVISTSGDIVTTGGSLSIAGTTTFGGIKYNWPAALTAGTFLTTDASGTLSWAPAATPFTSVNTIPKGSTAGLVASNISDNGSTVTFTSPSFDVANFTTTGTSDSRVTFTKGGTTVGEVGYASFNNTFGLSSLTPMDVAFGVNNFATEVLRLSSAGNVGIGTTAPSSKLHVAGSVTIADGTQANGYVLKSDAAGNASWAPMQSIAFSAYNSSAQTLSSGGWNFVTFPSEEYDLSGNYNTATSTFTVPTGGAGLYHFVANVNFSTPALGRYQIAIYVNSATKKSVDYNFETSSWQSTHIDCDLMLNAGDAVTIEIYCPSTSTYGSQSYVYFQGRKVN